MAAKKVYQLVRKASSHVGDNRVMRGETISATAYNKLDAKRKAYYDAVEVVEETKVPKKPAPKKPETPKDDG